MVSSSWRSDGVTTLPVPTDGSSGLLYCRADAVSATEFAGICVEGWVDPVPVTESELASALFVTDLRPGKARVTLALSVCFGLYLLSLLHAVRLWRRHFPPGVPTSKVRADQVLPESLASHKEAKYPSATDAEPPLPPGAISAGTGISVPALDLSQASTAAVAREAEPATDTALQELLDGPDLLLGKEQELDPAKPLYSHGRIPILSADLVDSRIGATKPKGFMPPARSADKMVSGRIPMDDSLRTLATKRLPAAGKGLISGRLTFAGLDRPPSLQLGTGMADASATGEQPLQTGRIPLQMGSLPLQMGKLPLQTGKLPLQTGKLPLRAGIVPGRLDGISLPRPGLPDQPAMSTLFGGNQGGLLRTTSMPQQRLFSDRIPMDLSSIHSRIPLEPGASRTPIATSFRPSALGGERATMSAARSPGLADISLADLALADEVPDAAIANRPSATAPKLVHSRIPMDLRPPARLDLLPQSISAPRFLSTNALQAPSPQPMQGDPQAGTGDPPAQLPSPPPSPPLDVPAKEGVPSAEPPHMAPIGVVQLGPHTKTPSVTSLAELGNSPLLMLWFFFRTEHTLGGAVFPPQRTAVDPPQRVQVLWNVIMLELAGVTLVATARTDDTYPVDWGHVLLDAVFIAVAGAVLGAVCKLLFRCVGTRRWLQPLAWLINLCAGCAGGFIFAWYTVDFVDVKSDRVFAGWGMALAFTWCVVEPFWVLTVVTLVHAVVLPATAALPPLPSASSHYKYTVEKSADKTDV
jgi:hypothetical protein